MPLRLRYLLAWDHDLCRTVVSVYVRAVLGFLRTRARRAGIANGRSGAVAIIQRFGGALNLNVHIHALVIDGVFTDDARGSAFIRLGASHVTMWGRWWPWSRGGSSGCWRGKGMTATSEESGATDTWAEEAPMLAGLAAASGQGLLALGPRAGARVVATAASRERGGADHRRYVRSRRRPRPARGDPRPSRRA